MSASALTIAGSYDYYLVVLSVVISIIAAYAALNLGRRVRAAHGGPRLLGLSGGAIALGIGIWSMHYIGMLALYLPVPVMYDWPTVLLSLLAAVGASGIALFVISRPRLGLPRAIIGSIVMGAAMIGKHYLGMSAMRLPAMSHYSWSIVTLSAVIAIGTSFVSIWLTFRSQGVAPGRGWQNPVGALVMGFAIPAVHYTNIAATSFSPAALTEHDVLHAVGVSVLGITGLVSATLMVLGLILLTSMADRQISQEVAERRQAETALVDSERTYGVTFDAAPFGMAHVSLDGRWLRINQRLCDLLGYTAEQIRATDFTALTHPDDKERSAEARRQLRAGLVDRQDLVKRYRCGDGRFIWASVTISVIRDAAGRPAQLLTTIEDVTARRDLEEQYRQAQKMEAIGQLAAGVAHDFNNLLTVIVGFGELTLDRLEPEHPARKDLLQVLHAGRSAALLTNQLLAFSRRQMLQPQILDLNAVVDRMEMLLRRTIGEEVALVFRLAPSVGRVSADPGQIEQVVMNLAVNARDAMQGGGVITIETGNVDLDEAYVATHHGASPGRHVRIAITDTGVGISDSVRAHLFEPFFSTKERGKGTGLGLATVYGIAQQSGGSIWVDSEVGRGSTFNLYLPRVEQVDEQTVPAPAPTSLGGTETILVTEDQQEVGSIMREMLVRHGYTVLEARGGEDALRVSRNHVGAIDLLLTDVVMPGMTGRDLARLLFEQRPHVRVLYTSGYTDHAILQHGVIESGLAFIQKPFSTGGLLRKVRDTLDKLEV